MLPNHSLEINSLTGNYTVEFTTLNEIHDVNFKYCIIDKRVWELYASTPFFKKIQNPILVEALETNKTAETALSIIEKLIETGITRGESITAIGGGIIQDIATFASSILYRGVKWTYFPTTLLAQCDSSIGGKSSLNFKSWKNLLGNFYPPSKIYICIEFLKTLEEREVRSGIGEMIKVHMLSSYESVLEMEDFLSNIMSSQTVMESAIFNSLKLKQSVIEQDEFDTGLRLKMNLGHTFGHALEVATDYALSHGLAVNIGLSMACYFAKSQNMLSEDNFNFLNKHISRNLRKSDLVSINYDSFMQALKKDKKNKTGEFCFIVPTAIGNVERMYFPMDENTYKILKDYLNNMEKFICAI